MILAGLLLAYSFSEFFRHFGFPRVIGQISAGLVLGLTPLKVLFFDSTNPLILGFLANLGIILLFFYIGLHLSFKGFSKTLSKSLSVSGFKALVPLILGSWFAFAFLKIDLLSSAIVGIALSAGAQSISLDLLEELNLLKSSLGEMLVSVGVITDVFELLLTAVVLYFLNASLVSSSPVFLLASIIGFIVFLLVLRFGLISIALGFFELEEKSSTSRFMAAMVIVLFIVSVADFIGIGAFIGAISAGIILRQTIFADKAIPDWKEHDIARSIHIIAFGFLIPLFFVWIGFNTDLSLVFSDLFLVSGLVLISLIGVVGGTLAAVLINKGSFNEGLLLGFGLSPKGDIGLILGALALESGFISSHLFSAIVAMSLIVTFISSIAFKFLLVNYKTSKNNFKKKK